MIAIANSISSNYVSGTTGPSYDPDAEAFFTAEAGAGVTLSDTEKTAVNTLVVNLKAANIWSKMKALYPFIGSTATSQKFNLINPADTNAAFRLAFTGGWTHSSTGALPNGTNAYADTFLATNALSLNSVHLSFYSRTNNTTVSVDMGGGNSTPDSYTIMQLRSYHAPTNTAIWINNTATYNSVTGVNTAAFFVGSRTASNVIKLFRNGSAIINGTAASSATSTRSQWIGAFNFVGAPYYSNRQCAFASIGDGLTDLEAQVFNQIVEQYQYTLGRNMSPAQSFYYNTAYNNETNAYLYSTQITDTTTQVATNTLVNDLKTAGVWTKMKAVYPMAGSTATTQKYNLVNSQDTDAAFRLNFVGGWTHSSLGATPNGTNAYANTFLNTTTNLSLNSGHLSFYSRTNSVDATIKIDIGSLKSTPNSYSDLALGSQNLSYFRFNNTTAYNSVSTTNTLGFYIGSRTASNIIKLFKNSSIIVNGTALSNATSLTNFYLGAANSNGSAIYYSTKQCAFASIGDGLTDAEAADFYTAVQNFQIALGRAIYLSPPTVSDSDAQAFINAANIVDQVEAPAINDLVIGLKADNLWTKMKAVYPMVGQIAISQKYNLKNPLDTNAAFRLTFAGGWTHDSLGATPNGTNAYANTFLNTTTNLSLNSGHLSFYSRTNSVDATLRVDIGSLKSTPDSYSDLQLGSNNSSQFRLNNTTTSNSVATTNTLGFYSGSRTASNIIKLFKNGSIIVNGTAPSNATSLINFYLGAANNNGTALYYSQKQCAFASIGDSLTDTEAANLYNRVQTFNTTLQRQV